MRVIAFISTLLIAAAALSGCGTLTGCTEIGYINTVTVRVTGGGASLVDDVTWCVADECAAGLTFDAERLGGGEWELQIGGSTPAEVTLTALDSSATVITTADVGVGWRATDSPNGPGCENGSVAEPVTLTVP